MLTSLPSAETPAAWIVSGMVNAKDWLRSLVMHALSPGKVKPDHIKGLIGELMTVSALLSGFSIGMSGKVTDDAIRKYATFLKAEFFGKHSHFCEFDRLQHFPGEAPLHDDVGVPDGDTCNADGCWVGHWATNQASADLGFEACSLTFEEVQAAYPDYVSDQIEAKVANVHLE